MNVSNPSPERKKKKPKKKDDSVTLEVKKKRQSIMKIIKRSNTKIDFCSKSNSF